MSNQVFLSPDNIIMVAYEGDQTGETVQAVHNEIEHHVESLLAAGKSVYIVVDITKIGKHDTTSHIASIDSLKRLQFEKLAVLGADPYIKHIGNFILRASGKSNIIAYVEDLLQAKNWFSQPDGTHATLLTGAKKVLVVDSSEECTLTFQQLFRPEECEVYCVSSMASAVTILTVEIPDIIVLDIMLTGGDNGFDFLEQIRKNPRTASIPVIIYTNFMGQQEQATALGVKEYFSKKDMSVARVVERVRELLGMKS